MSCYYPNGSPSHGDKPCNPKGDGPCCPDKWSCESNGLCYLDNAGYYGRYTCTDQSWNSPNCPQFCTYGKTATGDEAILQCSSGSYCCDTNRPNPGCCDTTTSRFSLAALPIIAGGGGTSGGTMSSAPSSIALSASSSSPPSNTPVSSSPPSSTSSPASQSNSGGNSAGSGSSGSGSSNPGSSSPVISVVTSVISESGGPSTLVTSASNTAVAASSSPTSTSSSNSKSLATIIGPAVGVPVAVLALMALAFFLFWRRRRNRRAEPVPTGQHTRIDDLTPMYGNETKPPIQNALYAGKSELEGSPHVGHPSPNPSTAPPSYRGVSGQQRPISELQGSPTVPTFRDSRGSELAASPLTGLSNSPREPQLPAVDEAPREGEPLPPELPGTTYRPYRPEGWQEPR